MWRVTIDQRTPSGGTQRYGPFNVPRSSVGDGDVLLCSAIEETIGAAGLLYVTTGQYQITVVPSRDEDD